MLKVEEQILSYLQKFTSKTLFLYRVGGEGLCVAYYEDAESEDVVSDLDEIGIPIKEAIEKAKSGGAIF